MITKYIIPAVGMLIILFIIMMTAGCKTKENTEFTDSPIIESYLEPGGYFNLAVSRQIPFSSDVEYSADDIDNLAITVLYNNSSVVLTPLGNGKYADSSLIVTEGIEYNITFSYNSKNVSAYTYIPTKPVNMTQSATQIYIEKTDSTSGPPTGTMPDPVKISWDNADGSYYLVAVENIETTLVPIHDFGDEAPPGNIFKKAPTKSNSEEIRPMDFQYYGTHRIILFHVLPDYASLYDQNSTSSQNITNPSTSIVNGYGIFTGLNSDTLYIEVKKK
ncbi:MAG: hypothetical protein NTW49_08670 [Bacteroidia bacterium]|nr:hypothetical protein [Bacteroidia bacterium]